MTWGLSGFKFKLKLKKEISKAPALIIHRHSSCDFKEEDIRELIFDILQQAI